MLKRAERNLIVGLDIGTSKVVALVGEVGIDFPELAWRVLETSFTRVPAHPAAARP